MVAGFYGLAEFHLVGAHEIGELVLAADVAEHHYAGGLRTSDGQPIRTFEIAEHDGLFFPAQAEIIDGKVKIRSEKITNPKQVRYGWQPFTRANLVNSDELPASTFRTKKQ